VPDGSFDLARELAAELGDLPEGAFAPPPELRYAIGDVVREMEGDTRPGAADDGDTHYDLAIAYREMGMLDEAIRELEVALAATPPRPAVDCHTMIGLCRLDKGDAAGAVDAYRRALATGAVSAEAARALWYDLARALQALGDEQGALWYFQKVLRADPRFRDVRDVVARLGGGPGRPPPGDPDAEDGPRRASAKKIGYV
jgi:tetratricopeptide (TPR) repeat protein